MAKRKTRRERRKFSAEFKQEVVTLIQQGDRTLPEVCRDLDLTDSSVRRWVEQIQGKTSIITAADQSESDKKELEHLRAENKRLKMEREILKKAAAFFAKESQ